MISNEQRDEFCDYLTSRTKNMVGKVLTTIEAMGMSESQEKAAKDLIKQEMWDHHYEVWHFFWKKLARPT